MTPDLQSLTNLAGAPVQYVSEPSLPRLAYRDVAGAPAPAVSRDGDHPVVGAAEAGTVFLIHGGGRSLMDWGPVVRELARGVRVVALDLPGHGQSEQGSWQMHDVLDGLDAVMAAAARVRPLGTGVSVAGHSIGGVLALAWAERQRSITGVVNVDGFPTSIDFAGRRWAQVGFMARALLGSARENMPGVDRLLRVALPALNAQTVGGTCPLPQQLPELLDASVPPEHVHGVVAALEAAMRPRADGRLVPRASGVTRAAMGRCISQLQLPALYGSCPVRSMTLDGQSLEREAQQLGLPWVATQLREVREQVWAEVTARSGERSPGHGMSRRTAVDAGHDMLFTRPSVVAEHIMAAHDVGVRTRTDGESAPG